MISLVSLMMGFYSPLEGGKTIPAVVSYYHGCEDRRCREGAVCYGSLKKEHEQELQIFMNLSTAKFNFHVAS